MKPRAVHRTRIAFKKFRYMVEQLRSLIPGLPGGLPGKLRGHQKLMGDIQDCETLLAALDKFVRKEKSEARPAPQIPRGGQTRPRQAHGAVSAARR